MKKPRLSYLICAGSGAGGSLIADAFCSCGQAGTPATYFSPGEVSKWARAFGIATDAEYVDKVIAAATGPGDVFGAQLDLDACDELRRRLTPERDTGGDIQVPLHELLREHLGEVRYIWVRRWNKVAQGIAKYRNDKIDALCDFEFQQIERCVQIAQEEDLRWMEYFRNPVMVLQIIYERFVQTPEHTVHGALGYLGLPHDGAAISVRNVIPQADEHVREWERRYRELENARKAIAAPRIDPPSPENRSEAEPNVVSQLPGGSDNAPRVFGAPIAGAGHAPSSSVQAVQPSAKVPRIFVPIPSYRDTECQWTVKDLFEKAKYPDRIFVGICWQTVPEEDVDCFQFNTRPEQCRELRFHVRDSIGTCWARQHAESLWRGEEYFFQIDAHNRFVQDWDDKLLTMLAACPSPRPILSTYAVPYVPPNKLSSGGYVRIHPQDFGEDGRLRIRTTTTSIADAPAIPEPSAFITGHFLFGPSQLIKDVPHDPYIYVNAEDNTWGPRLWTAGWDFFVPNQVLVYHDFTNRRVKHWDDHRDWSRLQSLSAKRIRHLFRTEVCTDPEAMRDFDLYDLGTRRSLAQYEAFANVDFRRRLVNGKTYEQITMEVPAEKRRARTREIFRRQWQDSRTGPKPKHKPKPPPPPATEDTQRELRRILEFLDIQILADAGCGDCSWITNISPSLRFYFGFDIIDELVQELRQRYAQQRGHFFNSADVTIDVLPACDAILCRDVFTRLPLPYVKAALGLFKASGSRYLIATTCEAERNWRLELEQSQDVSLTAPPFNLPAPMFLIGDPPGSKRSLGVWRLAGLPDFAGSASGLIRSTASPRVLTAATKNTVTHAVQHGAALSGIEDRFGFEFSGRSVKASAFGNGYLSELCRILDTYVEAAKSVLEWGSGLTTQVLAEYGQKKWNTDLLLTIDHNRSYQEAVFAGREKPSFLVAECLDQTGPTRSSADQGLNYSTFPINFRKTFDLVLIDGRRRMECAFIAATLCHAGTLVILHDYRRERYQPILALFDVVEDGPQFRVLRPRPAILAGLHAAHVEI